MEQPFSKTTISLIKSFICANNSQTIITMTIQKQALIKNANTHTVYMELKAGHEGGLMLGYITKLSGLVPLKA